ncbi:Alpha/beta hydrolase domain-containing protein 17C [Frankliniella fusca]|uniref:Alpha/beta hydrolase domain-containing protein 17C n=1 Tax=Frankliniella fusca TaxID=407009 RepID=A0AAE1GX73_9NEOP|nr:Alpha/beta hydrolase domain-containing protein 17C [Frankliniella fusca]
MTIRTLAGKDHGSDENLSSDEENSALNTSHVDYPPIYRGAPLKLSESMTAILTYITKHELDGREIVDLLNLINLHCKQEENEMRTSLYLFKKYFEGNKDISIFVEVPLIPQLQRMYSQEEFYKNLSYKNNRKKQNESNIEDIYDGQVYKELEQSGFFLNPDSLNFFMMLNADGVPVFKSSKKSLWPFFFSVLELPPNLRVKKEFTLIGGPWFGGKPMVNIILGKLLSSLKIIRKGFDVTPFGSDKTSTAKGLVLAATSDLPAKAMLLGMHTHSGAYSCHICKIKGESIKIESKKKKKGKQGNIRKKVQEDGEIENKDENENQKSSSVWVFRYEKDRDLRQQKEMITFGENAQKLLVATGDEKSHVFGVKHPSILFKIMFNTVKGFGIDDLHTLYLGTIKSLVRLWFDAKHGGEPFSIRKYLPVIGPMKTYSCFHSESLNGEFLKMIHGTRYVETQLASGCFLISQLPHKLAALQNKKTKDYCFKVLHPSLKLMKNEEVCKQPLIFTVGIYKKLSACQFHVKDLVQEYQHGNSTDISTFLRLKKDRTLFACRGPSYTRCSKTNSYTCSFVHDNAVNFGAIELFLKISSITPESAKFLAIIEKANTEVLCIGDKRVPHIKTYELTGNFIAVPVENLLKLLFRVEVDDLSYVCDPV